MKETKSQLMSAKTVAEQLDCSLSQFYKEVKIRRFPQPTVKLWGNSKRGWRWEEAIVEAWIRSQKSGINDQEEDEGPVVPFVKLNWQDFVRGERAA